MGRYIVEDGAQKSTYIDRKGEGMTWWYNDKGTVKSQVNFSNDKENGLYTSSYANGKVIRTEEFKMDRNPVMIKILKDKREETLIDLSKYGLIPQNTSQKMRMR